MTWQAVCTMYYPSCIMYRVARVDVTPDMEKSKSEKTDRWERPSQSSPLSSLYLFHFQCDIHPSYCVCVGICTFAIESILQLSREEEVRVAS